MSLQLFFVIFCLFCFTSSPFLLSVFCQGFPEEKLDKSGSGKSANNIEYNADGFSDPFLCPIKVKKDGTGMEKGIEARKASELFSLSVQGIIWNSDVPVAIINNKVIKKGEVFVMSEGKKQAGKIIIVDIDKDGVVIDYSGEIEKLPAPAALKLPAKKNDKGPF